MSVPSSRNLLFLAVAVGPVVAIWFNAPIPQDPTYHEFADQRRLIGIANFWNVASNLPFALLGAWGVAAKHRLRPCVSNSAYLTFCIGVCLVAVGSSYYHLDPSTATLFWDRLPMTVAFMALFAIVIGDRLSRRLGDRLLWPLVIAGVSSIVYWYWTELQGRGDLRAYVLVQFLPMLLIPLALSLYPGNGINARWLWVMLVVYGCAKIAEYLDGIIYATTSMGGHSVKHALASLAVWLVLRAVLHGSLPPTPVAARQPSARPGQGAWHDPGLRPGHQTAQPAAPSHNQRRKAP